MNVYSFLYINIIMDEMVFGQVKNWVTLFIMGYLKFQFPLYFKVKYDTWDLNNEFCFVPFSSFL